MNDIVAEFASSYYKEGETLPESFSVGDLKQYHVVEGSVFSDEYNETLDSAVLVLDHIKVKDRLVNIEPYEYVHVFDKNNSANFDRLYLIDNFSEQEKNIDRNFFSYTINLMSETKLLEKIQCPNLTITHRIEAGNINKKTIYEYICQYVELYSPGIKTRNGTSWQYEKLITIPGTDSEFYDKFNVPCADMAFAMPTLRQLLTALMQQVGCIPTLNGGVLGYLDLRAEPESFGPDFTADYSVSRIQRSLSSDSYANTLVNISDNVLDSGNKVVSERLGFRDRNNVALKQTQNLFLETKFPIYKIESFKMNFYSNIHGLQNLDGPNNVKDEDGNQVGTIQYGSMTDDSGNRRKVFTITVNLDSSKDYQTLTYYLNIVFINSDGAKIYEVNENQTQSYYQSQTSLIINCDLGDYYSQVDSFYFYIKLLSATYIDSGQTITQTFGIDFDYGTYPEIVHFESHFFNYWPVITKIDITPLIVENSIRANLETNFKNMNNVTSLEQLASYLYGTIGYTIGSNIISGFSDTYAQAYAKVFGTVNKTYTYIENIIKKIRTFNESDFVQSFLDTYEASGFVIRDQMISGNMYIADLQNNIVSFAAITFDIEYQPLNSFNLSFVKQNRDIPFTLEQLDTNASGLTDFDRLVLREQETVDRIGNVVLSISQRANSLEDIRGTTNGRFSLTYFQDDLNRDKDWNDENEDRKYIIFKRQIAVCNYYYDVSYTGMENAILKDYFTSIRTKYRAYEYVDYNQSVLRKEKDVIFVNIGLGWLYNASDTIHFPFYNSVSCFIDGWTVYTHNQDHYDTNNKIYGDKVKYICEISWGKNPAYMPENAVNVVKNDASIITADNVMAFIYEQIDNASAGPFISSVNYTTFYTNPNYTDDDPENENAVKIGGVPQTWQRWISDYYLVDHPIMFVSSINLDIFDASSYSLTRSAMLPIVNGAVYNRVEGSAWDFTSDNSKKFTIGKKANGNGLTTMGGDWTRLFYKDYAERINHTVQFIYYTPHPENVGWTELFIQNSSLIQQMDYGVVSNYTIDGSTWDTVNLQMKLVCFTDEDMKLQLNKEWHTDFDSTPADVIDQGTDWSNIIQLTTENGVPCIKITWGDYYEITVCRYAYKADTHFYQDMISFKRPKREVLNSIVPLASPGEHIVVPITQYEYDTTTNFYVSFNDTKSEYVFTRENGLLRKIGKVEPNVNQRKIIDL